MRARVVLLSFLAACTTELGESTDELTGDPVIDCPVV
jgi:hypothetical protein